MSRNPAFLDAEYDGEAKYVSQGLGMLFINEKRHEQDPELYEAYGKARDALITLQQILRARVPEVIRLG